MENQNKPRKFKSFFDNNVNYTSDKSELAIVKKLVDILDKRVKVLEETIKRMTNEQNQRKG